MPNGRDRSLTRPSYGLIYILTRQQDYLPVACGPYKFNNPASHPKVGSPVTTRIELAAELETIHKQHKVISRIVWGTAALVMIFGVPIVFEFLTQHGVPGEIAWILSIASDGGLCVGLVGTPVLATYEIPAGWIGTLRWVAGFLTWGLQTAGSWFRPEGADGVGVLAHSAGPVLLFFVVEGASYFQRKMSHVSSTKRLELEALDRQKQDEKSALEDLRRRLAAAEAARSEALRRVKVMESETASIASLRESEGASAEQWRSSLEDQLRSAEAAVEALREEARRETEALRAQHAEALRTLRLKHREELAEASVIKLSDRRRPSGGAPSGGSGGGTPKAIGGASKPSTGAASNGRLSDEAAVQRLLEHDGNLSKQWRQSEIVKLLGVGYSRAPRLAEAVSEEQLRRASGAEAASG